jgi:protein SCO1/2
MRGVYAILALAGGMVVALFLLGERSTSVTVAPLTGASTNIQVYQARGVVRELMPDGQSARIAHEAIPGFMGAMTMVLDVKDTNELKRVEPGDLVRFEMVITPEDGWIRKVERYGHTNLPGPPKPEQFRKVRNVDELAEGDALTNYTLTNQFGRAFQLADFKGQALAITFIFTRCPYPDFCPRMTGNFAAAQQKLKTTPGAPTNWHFLSLSFDVAHDIPPVLHAYAQRQHYDPAHWTFATGALIDIDAITEQFGLYFIPDGANFNHNVRTAVVNAEGKISKILVGNTWKSEELVAAIEQAASAR